MRSALVILGLSGLGLVAGGLLHPRVPADGAEQMRVFATHALWAPSHWVLTLSQLAGVVGLALLLAELRPSGPDGRLWAGLLLSALGLLVGALGTLSAATVVQKAARGPDAALFGLAAAWTMDVGWLCLVTAAAGGLLVGACLARGGLVGWRRAFGRVALAGNGAFLAAALALGPSHPWTHPYALRLGAIGFGLLLVAAAAGWWRALAGAPLGGDEEAGGRVRAGGRP